jgi:hypothetical protein
MDWIWKTTKHEGVERPHTYFVSSGGDIDGTVAHADEDALQRSAQQRRARAEAAERRRADSARSAYAAVKEMAGVRRR